MKGPETRVHTVFLSFILMQEDKKYIDDDKSLNSYDRINVGALEGGMLEKGHFHVS